jgi:hypothetical protein
MKEDQLKKAFKGSFKKEAPVDFTQSVLAEIEHSSSKHHSLLPKPVLWIMAVFVFVLIALIIIVLPNKAIQLPLQESVQIITKLVSILILPMVIICLLFIKSIFSHSKVV